MRNLYLYVDACKEGQGGRLTKWFRIALADVDEMLRIPAKNYNIFTTVQRFKRMAPETGEPQWVPLYFDFDSADVDKALVDTRKVVQYFAGMGIDRPYIRVWFSGSKGFHVTVEPECFNLKPHPGLTYQIKGGCMYLAENLGLETLDRSVYSIRRQWRVPHSAHAKTRLFAVELSHQDLALPLPEIKAKAKEPGEPLFDVMEYDGIGKVSTAQDWWRRFLKEWQDRETLRKLTPRKPIKVSAEMPVCVKDLLENGLRKPGTRNQATLVLASFYKDTGASIEAAEAALRQWTLDIPDHLTSQKGDIARVAGLRSVLHSVFEDKDEKYHFACAFARALGSDEAPVRCDWKLCKVAHEEDQQCEKPIALNFAECSNAVYTGKKLAWRAMVSGKDTAPYVVPKHVRLTCSPDTDRENSRCKGCAMGPEGAQGHTEIILTPDQPELLAFTGSSDAQIKGAIKKLAGVPPRCEGVRLEIIEHTNIQDLQQINEIEFRPDNMLDDGEFVVRRAYYVGHTVETNKTYDCVGYMIPDPRNQYAVLVFDESGKTEARDSLANFEVTPELVSLLKPFQGDPGERFKALHDDLEHNITHIWGRQKIAYAFDLVMHSVLGFHFQGDFIQRGWLECMILGDTGQAKTTLVNRLMNHYEAGQLITGETARRTGLIYNIQQTSGRWFLQWGAIPLNDRRLLVIDEFSGLDPEEVEKMSALRATGIADVNAVIRAKTPARTRLLYMSNTRSGRPLAAYSFGCEAVLELFNKVEDVRRLDMALTVASGEVDPSVINQRHQSTTPHTHRTEMCHALVLWAWTRTPADVKFTDEATTAILSEATAMSTEYHASIPLAEPADMRLKLARGAAATAARVFSTDDGHKLIVKPEHVTFFAGFLNQCYRAPSMRYSEWSRTAFRRETIAPDVRMALTLEIDQFPEKKELVEYLLGAKIIRKRQWDMQWEDFADPAKRLMTLCLRKNLLLQTSNGMYAAPAFKEWLHDKRQTLSLPETPSWAE